MKRSSSPSIDVVVAGYLGLDLAPAFPRGRSVISIGELLRPGKVVEVTGLDISLGGVVANSGLAFKRFGRRVALMGCIGTDALGEMAHRILCDQGIRRGIRKSAKAGTAFGIVFAPPGVDRIFFEDTGCNNLFSAADVDYAVVRCSRVFHLGYPTLMRRLYEQDGRELRKILRRVKRLGVVVSLDTALPDAEGPAGRVNWRRLLREVLPWVDIFLPSIEELYYMLEPAAYSRALAQAKAGDIIQMIPATTYERLAAVALEMGAKVVMIKAGPRGAFIRTGETGGLCRAFGPGFPVENWNRRSLWIDPFPVAARRFRNASGAGDCAVAGFLSAMIEGTTVERAAQYAMLAGRDNLYGVDAISGLRDWDTMTEYLENRASSS
jgi:sugar/nucleoside kinase (ribokinase family)